MAVAAPVVVAAEVGQYGSIMLVLTRLVLTTAADAAQKACQPQKGHVLSLLLHPWF